MNTHHQPDHLVEASVMDRLVDGELNDQQRRELLQQLEEKPTGWRQCALAFLEAQLWSKDLQQMASETTASASPSVPEPRPSEPKKSKSFGWWATAAAILFAFGLGQRMDRAGNLTPNNTGTQLAVDDRAAGLPAATEQWLTSSQVPSDVERLFEKLGAQVNEERGWVLRQSSDGRPTVVPYKEVQIVPVRGPTY